MDLSSDLPASAMHVRIGQSRHRDSRLAAMDISRQIAQPDIGLSIVFAACQHDLPLLCATLATTLAPDAMIGCTTVGEIGPSGYGDGDVVAVSIHRKDMDFELGLLESVSTADSHLAHELASSLTNRLHDGSLAASLGTSFALMLIDGASAREESIAHAFQVGLGGCHLVGATAGTDLPMQNARLIFNGRVVTDAAILLVATTPHPFETFKIQHFEAGGAPLVITGALPGQRIVTEINGLPAASEYAHALGLPAGDITADTFVPYPTVAVLGSDVFVRTIRHANPDGSLSFYSCIEPGMVLRPARSLDMVESLTHAAADLRLHIGTPCLTLGFDCMLRSAEMFRKGLQQEVAGIMNGLQTVGFCTLGEQYCGTHVNQTLTGIAFGRKDRP